MSFSINNSKVEELLESTSNLGAAFPSIFAIEDAPVYPTHTAGGVAFAYSEPVSPDARANLLSLRKRIEDSGLELINSDDLDSEIREIRR